MSAERLRTCARTRAVRAHTVKLIKKGKSFEITAIFIVYPVLNEEM